MDEITQILEALKEGDTQAPGKLLPIADNERDGHTLQASINDPS